ncbi:MAG: hypothetical protein ACLR7U_07865 [Ruthenibacterium lactatiformans]
MRRSKFYNMRLPERGAREGEANDAADIEDLTYDLGIIDAEMERQRLEDVRLEKEKATKLELSQHKAADVLDHPDDSVTDAKIGPRTVLTTSGTLQTLLTAIGNAIRAVAGTGTWNGAPATTLAAAKAHMDSGSNPHGVTAQQAGALPLSGGVMTGDLTLHAAPTENMHATTKKYVDDQMAASGSGDMTKAVYDPDGRGLPLLPETGNGSNVTVEFTETAQDADIASGEKLSVLFGKIKKRFSTYDADGDGVVDRAAAADRVAKKFILQNNAGQQMAEFDGSADRTVQLTPGQVGAEPAFTKNNAFNKNFGSAAGTVCQGNDGRLSNARRASNISMSLSGTTLTINYS